ncbi:hypothetical protein NQZ68_030699 [Dissostichus eleginoides]|nr:hypothetical protein NQZ68_030699 [Dissostichus eleginoides]
MNSSVPDGDSQSPVTGPNSVDSERRTIAWITELSTPSPSEVDVSDLQSTSSNPRGISDLPDEAVSCVSGLVTAVDSRSQVGLSDSDTVTRGTDSDVLNSQARSALSNVQTQVRTRLGRLVKPVDRLIQDVIPGLGQ